MTEETLNKLEAQKDYLNNTIQQATGRRVTEVLKDLIESFEQIVVALKKEKARYERI